MSRLYIYLIGSALVLAALWGWGQKRYNDGQDSQKAKHALVLTAIADKTREAAVKARNVEREWTAMLDAIAQAHQQDLRDAQTLYDTTVADLRSGAVRLQDRWSCPATHMPSATARPGEPDAAADDRSESAGRIIRAAAECDAQVRRLQAVTQSDRSGPQQ